MRTRPLCEFSDSERAGVFSGDNEEDSVSCANASSKRSCYAVHKDDRTISRMPTTNDKTLEPTPRTHPYPPAPGNPRELNFDGLPNVRDLGGIPLADRSGVVDCGRVLRSASPQLLTEQGAEQLIAYGVKTVIDLRSPTEAETEGSGPLTRHYNDGTLQRINVALLSDMQRKTDPVGTADAVEDPSQHYINYLADPSPFIRISRALLDATAQGGSVLLHCALGKDRTGVSAAVLLDVAGADHGSVVHDYDWTRHHVRQIVERLGATGSYRRDFTTPDWDSLAPQPAGIAGMLEWLHQRFGGAGDYLHQGGLDLSELAQLRNVLRYLPSTH